MTSFGNQLHWIECLILGNSEKKLNAHDHPRKLQKYGLSMNKDAWNKDGIISLWSIESLGPLIYLPALGGFALHGAYRWALSLYPVRTKWKKTVISFMIDT